jgi:hypothetical protein
MIDKLFEKILLTRILSDANGRGLLRHVQFGFRPKQSTEPHLAHLFERVSRNFHDKKPTRAVFLDVAKAFDTLWVDGLPYNLTFRKFPRTLWEIYLPLCMGGRSKRPSKQPQPLFVAFGPAWLGVKECPLSYPVCTSTIFLRLPAKLSWLPTRMTRPS